MSPSLLRTIIAAVIVSLIHIKKGIYQGRVSLNGKEVDRISAFLFHIGLDTDPKKLLINKNTCFSGYYIHGAGFTFDNDSNETESLSVMESIMASKPENSKLIHPYIGGYELLANPQQEHQRYVIDFNEMSEEEAREYPLLFEIAERRVKPERLKNNRDHYREYWWQYAENRPGLRKATIGLERILVHPFTSEHLAFVFLPATTYVASPHCVFAIEQYSSFYVLQSRCHEIWTRFFSSSLEDRLRYTASDCFETFPFPENWETNPTLETIGKEYYEYRTALMVRNNEGLTDTYNRFHDPDDNHPDILKLRQLHSLCDRAVLDAYGWSDISTDCTFLLDYEEEEEESTGRQKKKPWRYRWSEEVHDDVLARLILLNQQRAEAESLGGKIVDKTKAKGNTKKERKSSRATPKDVTIPELF